MDLKHAVLDYAIVNLDQLAQDYQRAFSLEMLDVSITPGGRNWLEKNISLRRALHEQWKLFPYHRQHLVAWYVREWGGIKTNSRDTLNRYSTIEPHRLISRGDVGIASWSKALSIVDPLHYAIYNARIATALHAIQIIKDVRNPVYFPDLNSRHTAIKPIIQTSRRTIKRFWTPVHKPTFYAQYNVLLQEVALAMGDGVTPQAIEILLSSHAMTLVEQSMGPQIITDHQ